MLSTDQLLPEMCIEGFEKPLAVLPNGDLLDALAEYDEPAVAIPRFLAKLSQQFGFGPVVDLFAKLER